MLASDLPEIDLSSTCLQNPPILEFLGSYINEVLSYSAPEAYEELAVVVGELLDVPRSCVVFGNGAAELIDAVTSYSPFRDVVILAPTFFLYERFALKHKSRVHMLNWVWKDWLERVEQILARAPALVWLVNPNNPTAHKLQEDWILKLLEWKRCIIAIDESFADFGGTSLAKRAALTDRMIVIRSFSKGFGLAGARVGYSISGDRLASELRVRMDPLSTSRVGVKLAAHCITKLLPAYRARWREIANRIPEFQSNLASSGLDLLTGPCNFVGLRFSSQEESASYLRMARAYRMVLREGWNWEFCGESHCMIRVSVPDGSKWETCIKRFRHISAEYSRRHENE